MFRCRFGIGQDLYMTSTAAVGGDGGRSTYIAIGDTAGCSIVGTARGIARSTTRGTTGCVVVVVAGCGGGGS